MANEDFIRQLAFNFCKFTSRALGEVLVARELAGNVASGDTLARRVLKDMEAMGELKIEKHGMKGVYMLPKLTGYSEHDEIITDALVKIGSRYDFVAMRERFVAQVSMRPDVIVRVDHCGKICILVVEAINHETESYFQSKKNTWEKWNDSREFLSETFGVKVPFFHLVTHEKKMGDTLTLSEALTLMEDING